MSFLIIEDLFKCICGIKLKLYKIRRNCLYFKLYNDFFKFVIFFLDMFIGNFF